MQTKWHKSIRFQMVLMFVASLFIAAVGVVVLLLLLDRFQPNSFLRILPQFFLQSLGPVPTGVGFGLTFFVVTFFLLTQRTVRRIEELNRAVDQVAWGNFAISLPVKAEDELGQLGRNLVRMTGQLKASIEKERQAQESRSELITSVSHDLRTPLTAMLGYLELIDQDRYRDEVELRHYVSIAYDKCQQLKRMTDQLFEFTRTSHAGLRLRPVAVNLGELLEQLAEEFVPALDQAGMHYKLNVPPEPIRAMVDPDLLVRALQNLMTNAIRYGREGRQVDLELARAGNRVLLRVANYGDPIPERELPRIFDSFYRLERSRSTRTGGAGLGLAIVRNILELHGGTVTAYNEPERTVFELRVPASAVLPEGRVTAIGG